MTVAKIIENGGGIKFKFYLKTLLVPYLYLFGLTTSLSPLLDPDKTFFVFYRVTYMYVTFIVRYCALCSAPVCLFIPFICTSKLEPTATLFVIHIHSLEKSG